MLTLTPYYSFRRGQMDIRVGADIDLSFNAGPSESRYSLFHIAPDVNFDLRTGPVGLYLHLRGGSELQTLASLWQLDYYQMPGGGFRPLLRGVALGERGLEVVRPHSAARMVYVHARLRFRGCAGA